MARILALSSYVAHGAVGLRATLPPLTASGADIIALPTICLSNHPGHAHTAGQALSPELLQQMIEAIAANGWLTGVDAVLTGYLPGAAHAELAVSLVARIKASNPDVLFVCDPVFGDDPAGPYLTQDVAKTIRSKLLPLSSIATPNRFELEWLSGQPVRDVGSAVSAAAKLNVDRVAVTSVPAGDHRLANVLVTRSGAWAATVPKLANVPHGTGDLFTGLLLANILKGAADDAALAYAVGGVSKAIEASGRGRDLALAGLDWTAGAVTPASSAAVWLAR